MNEPEPLRHNIKISKRKKDGSFNLTGYQLALLADAAKQGTGGDGPGKDVTWEMDGGLVVRGLTDAELRLAVAYLGQLGRGRVIEVQHVGRD